MDDKEVNAFNMPEETKEQIICKISALAWQIRADWTDPRSECRRIADLCEKLRSLI